LPFSPSLCPCCCSPLVGPWHAACPHTGGGAQRAITRRHAGAAGLDQRVGAHALVSPRTCTIEVVSHTPEQVGRLLAAAHHDRRPWLMAFTILAAATGARTGELCGLE
jgi:integrase